MAAGYRVGSKPILGDEIFRYLIMSAVPKILLTPVEYLALERKADFKSQFFEGEMFAMAGASFEHNQIVANLVGAFGNVLLSSKCQILPSDMRVAIEPRYNYTYPDAVVVCKEPRFVDDQFDTLLNPKVVIEVLSDSTEKYDLGRKFSAYRNMPSVESIVFVRQDFPHVDVYTRHNDESWLLTRTSKLQDSVAVEAIDATVAIKEIYRNVVFKPIAEVEPNTLLR